MQMAITITRKQAKPHTEPTVMKINTQTKPLGQTPQHELPCPKEGSDGSRPIVVLLSRFQAEAPLLSSSLVGIMGLGCVGLGV